MPWFDFFWHDENIRHLGENGVSPEEFEAVMMAAKLVEISRSGSEMLRGKTSAGRWLICIFNRIDDISVLPITAFEPTK